MKFQNTNFKNKPTVQQLIVGDELKIAFFGADLRPSQFEVLA